MGCFGSGRVKIHASIMMVGIPIKALMCSDLQVKEGTEGRGAIESILRVVRRTVRYKQFMTIFTSSHSLSPLP